MTITFDVTWKNLPDTGGDGSSLGWGDAILSVNGEPVWCRETFPKVVPISWSWIELLEFLGDKWTYLLAEQTYPMGLTPKTPNDLRSEAEARWADKQLYRRDLEDDEDLFRFEGRHDLARGLRGINLPSILVVREGRQAWVCTPEANHYLELSAVVSALEVIGSQLADHVKQSSSARAVAAVKNWDARDRPDARALISLTTGLGVKALRSDAKYQTLEFWELESMADADSELAAAARLLPGAALAKPEIDGLLDMIRDLPPVPTPELDALANVLAPKMEEMKGEDPYLQGYEAAVTVRTHLNLGDGRIEPKDVLQGFGILLIRTSLSEVIDAVGCWGPRHGPGIVLNLRGKRSKSPQGMRATLAHELCHLLLDRSKALPMAEVLGGKSPYGPERRSNAFAAEFLFPQHQAREVYKRAKNLEEALTNASETFDVSRSLAAAQFLNTGRHTLSGPDQVKLRTIIGDASGSEDYSWRF